MKQATVTIGLCQWNADAVLAFGSEQEFICSEWGASNYSHISDEKELKKTLKDVHRECKRVYKPKEVIETPE